MYESLIDTRKRAYIEEISRQDCVLFLAWDGTDVYATCPDSVF